MLLSHSSRHAGGPRLDDMRTREYVGPWACVRCGSKLWATARARGEGIRGQRCHACGTGRVIPERRVEPRLPRRERRRTHTATL